MGRKAHPLAARIKKMMQKDEDVGKIAQATPIMIARAMELFLHRLCNKATEVAAGRKAKTLTTSHLKAYVSSDELMDFLKDTVANAPDLPPEGEPEAPKPKRQRTDSKRDIRTSAEGKRSSADGGAAGAGAAAAPSAAATSVPATGAAAGQHPKQEDTGSPTAHAAHAKLGHGFGGLGAHPFLAARSFGKPGGLGAGVKRRAGSSTSPKPESPSHKQQHNKGQGVAAAADEGSPPPAAGVKAEPEQEQQQQGQQPAGDAAALPGLPGMLSVQALQNFTKQDDFDDDYDS